MRKKLTLKAIKPLRDRHKLYRQWTPVSVEDHIARRDLYLVIDWSIPTRLDQEINRIFVYYKTTRAELSR